MLPPQVEERRLHRITSAKPAEYQALLRVVNQVRVVQEVVDQPAKQAIVQHTAALVQVGLAHQDLQQDFEAPVIPAYRAHRLDYSSSYARVHAPIYTVWCWRPGRALT